MAETARRQPLRRVDNTVTANAVLTTEKSTREQPEGEASRTQLDEAAPALQSNDSASSRHGDDSADRSAAGGLGLHEEPTLTEALRAQHALTFQLKGEVGDMSRQLARTEAELRSMTKRAVRAHIEPSGAVLDVPARSAPEAAAALEIAKSDAADAAMKAAAAETSAAVEEARAEAAKVAAVEAGLRAARAARVASLEAARAAVKA